MSESATASPETLRPLILVIDDERTTHLLIRSFLKPTGLSVLGAFDGAEGLALAELHRPDLVLVDLTMPGWSGVETLEHLRRLPETPPRRLLAMSAASPTDEAHRPWDDFLSKPFSATDLLKFLSKHLTFVDEFRGSP